MTKVSCRCSLLCYCFGTSSYVRYLNVSSISVWCKQETHPFAETGELIVRRHWVSPQAGSLGIRWFISWTSAKPNYIGLDVRESGFVIFGLHSAWSPARLSPVCVYVLVKKANCFPSSWITLYLPDVKHHLVFVHFSSWRRYRKLWQLNVRCFAKKKIQETDL